MPFELAIRPRGNPVTSEEFHKLMMAKGKPLPSGDAYLMTHSASIPWLLKLKSQRNVLKPHA